MKIRETKSGKILVFPEEHEYRALKLLMLEEGNPVDDFRDSTAGCYVLRSMTVKDLTDCGFKVEKLTRQQYKKMIADVLEKGYDSEV